VEHTRSKKCDIADLSSDHKIRHLLRDNLQAFGRNQVYCDPETHSVKDELVHNDVNHHHQGEQGKKNKTDYPSPFETSLESENAIQKGCGEKVHR
jgi:hypothetical protein